MKEKVKIDDRYLPTEELNHNKKPYEALSRVLSNTFEFTSLFDAGCRDGQLLFEVYKQDQSKVVRGCDYFQWCLDAADPLVSPMVYQWDLRDRIEESSYDIVTCFEVAEHIDKDYCDVFLENLRLMTNKYMIITWSDSGGENQREFDTHLQHLNPLKKDEVISVVAKYFNLETELSNKFLESSNKESDFLWYWRKSLTVWSPK